MASVPLTQEEKDRILNEYESMDLYAQLAYKFGNPNLRSSGIALRYPTILDAYGNIYKYKNKNGSQSTAYFYCNCKVNDCQATATVNITKGTTTYEKQHTEQTKEDGKKDDILVVRETCKQIVIKDQFIHPLEVQRLLQEMYKGKDVTMLTFQDIQRIVYDIRSSNKIGEEDMLLKFTTTRAETFFWFHYKEGEDFAYAFSTPFQQKRAQESLHSQFFLDNYYKVPAPFAQVLNLIVYDEKINLFIPLVHILVSTKRQEFYQAILTLVKEKLSVRDKEGSIMKPFKPFLLTVDYERGLYQAAKSALGLSTDQLVGCLFHYSQAIWRRMNDLGLRKKEILRTTNQVANALILLAFVDMELIDDCFARVAEAFAHVKLYDEVFVYFRKTWLGDIKREIWNHSRRLNDFAALKMTNNAIESFHNQILLNCSKVILVSR